MDKLYREVAGHRRALLALAMGSPSPKIELNFGQSTRLLPTHVGDDMKAGSGDIVGVRRASLLPCTQIRRPLEHLPSEASRLKLRGRGYRLLSGQLQGPLKRDYRRTLNVPS